jgi:hypothetical protein
MTDLLYEKEGARQQGLRDARAEGRVEGIALGEALAMERLAKGLRDDIDERLVVARTSTAHLCKLLYLL